MTNAGFIETHDLKFSYATDEGEIARLVIDGLDLTIEKGSFTAVVGRNGSGKSTLAKLFNAILLPVGGKVYVSGLDTADEDRLFDIRQKVGMVFQNPDNQIVATVVEEDVAFALENLGVPPDEMRKRVDEALMQVGMIEYKTHAPHMLSGGQKQRVAIAGVIAMRPECIVLDEPTAMLDPSGRREVVATIKELNRHYGVTVVLITHHMNEAAEADRVIVMDEGRISLDGQPREIFSKPGELRALGLTAPQTAELIYELNNRGFDLRGDAITVEECAQELLRYITGEI